jgi:hypothetical protein
MQKKVICKCVKKDMETLAEKKNIGQRNGSRIDAA